MEDKKCHCAACKYLRKKKPEELTESTVKRCYLWHETHNTNNTMEDKQNGTNNTNTRNNT